MYHIYWKRRSNATSHGEDHYTIEDAVEKFKVAFSDLSERGGGMVILFNERDKALLGWHEEVGGCYCGGEAVIEYTPTAELESCGNTWCSTSITDAPDLCEACEHKVLDICLDRLVEDLSLENTK